MSEPRVVAALAAAALVATLTACTDNANPMPTPAPPSSTPSASPSIEPEPTPTEEEPPDFLPGGSALANKKYFDWVNTQYFANNSQPRGTAIIDNLIGAGFDRTLMELTKDTTPTGRAVEAIEFSVRARDDCLLGQWGKGIYTSYIAPVLANGRCLIGDTIPVDW